MKNEEFRLTHCLHHYEFTDKSEYYYLYDIAVITTEGREVDLRRPNTEGT